MASVSEINNFIFIHIYKCGGNSVRRAIGSPSIGQPKINTISAYEIHGVHANIADVKHHLYKKGMSKFYDNAFRFTVIRNPFGQLVSLYKYIRSSKIHPFHKEMLSKNYYQFLHWYINDAMNFDRPYGSNKYQFLYEFLSADGQSEIDYIMRLENLDYDMKYTCMRLNVPYTKPLVINASSSKKPYREYYDKRCRDFFEHHFAEDLTLFDYKF